jgi:hypothetical protein
MSPELNNNPCMCAGRSGLTKQKLLDFVSHTRANLCAFVCACVFVCLCVFSDNGLCGSGLTNTLKLTCACVCLCVCLCVCMCVCHIINFVNLARAYVQMMAQDAAAARNNSELPFSVKVSCSSQKKCPPLDF